MHLGVTLPNMGVGGDIHTLVELAVEAEQAGWEGVFVWDALAIEPEDPAVRATCDPWIALAAIAMRTERVRIGPYVTPLSRRRPWKVARETATLDHLSHGRLILPVALGATDDGAFRKVGEELDRKVRAELLDESLAILDGLWSGRPFAFDGKHYHLDEMIFEPAPVQQPRIPVWVVGAWPRAKSMERAIRWDGILPSRMIKGDDNHEMTVADVAQMRDYIIAHRPAADPASFDIVIEDMKLEEDRGRYIEQLGAYQEAGVTWWIEDVWAKASLDGMRRRIHLGPPSLD